MKKTSGRNQTFYELRERFEQTTSKSDKQVCPICQLTLEEVQRYLNQLSYENVNEPEIRFRLRDAGGFCNRHAWQWFSLNDALGSALIYGDVAKMVQARLAKDEFHSPKVEAGFWKKLRGASAENTPDSAAPGITQREDLGLKGCPACEIQAANQRRVLEEFAAGLSDASFRQAYVVSAGICLPHLASAQQLIDNPETSYFLQQTEIAKWQELEAELGQMVDKLNFDHKRGVQEIGPEKFGVRRAIWKASGLAGLS